METQRIQTLAELVPLVAGLKNAGKKIVTTNGCFDIVHIGHVRNLEWAKRHGDVLVVGLNSDASVRKNKGEKRPINSEQDRAEVIAGLRAVDYVFIFDDETPIPWLLMLKPEVHVKGAEGARRPEDFIEAATVASGGGIVLLAPRVEGRSTTSLIEKILSTR